MDIINLPIKSKEALAMAYQAARIVFEVEPAQAPERQQKKIRKWIETTYDYDTVLMNALDSLTENGNRDGDFFAILAQCAQAIQQRDEKNKQEREIVIQDFPENVQKAITHLFDRYDYFDRVQIQKGRIAFLLEEAVCYVRTLILETEIQPSVTEWDYLHLQGAQILKTDNGYMLTCQAMCIDEDATLPITISFHNATVETELFRADRRLFFNTPWETLSLISSDILEKAYLGDGYFNPKELALLPLLEELREFCRTPLDQTQMPTFAVLKPYFAKYGLKKQILLLEKLAFAHNDPGKKRRIRNRLYDQMNMADCESLWRELYGLIVDSQEGYADPVDAYSKRRRNYARSVVQKKLQELGYEGEYPTFRKKGTMKGIHLEENYDQTYFVGMEKNVEYLIHCTETALDDELQIHFLCTTALLKEGEQVADAYSCCFNAKGRRLFKHIYYVGAGDYRLLEQYASMADKKARCTKLTKEEKTLLGNPSASPLEMILLFLFAGGGFTLLMMGVMFLICCLATGLIVGFHSVPEMIGHMPWGKLSLFCFVGFGGTMAIVEAKAKKK